ncbi:MAG TPA: radical SAM protein, partial [Candidatus Nanoarchaeia archaeon]|nr:radical SAM protein [Candidatus Nanoarchaeia archaeon]
MDLITSCFERAIFLSWYCSKADCAFCYMSTQKDKIREPTKARRSFASIFAEAIISKACGWEIEFLSGGYDSFSNQELLFIIKGIYEITGKKQWLNLGTLDEAELKLFKPYVEGVIGTLECAN